VSVGSQSSHSVAMHTPVLLLFVILASRDFVSGAGVCTKPTISATSFVSEDALFHWNTAFVVEFVLKCQNEVKDLPIFAEINGRLIPAALSLESSRYQVSWTAEHKDAPAGTYTINLHTEDGYAAVRKAQRNNEDIGKITPLSTITVQHKGSYSGPWVQTPMMATAVALLVVYFAYSRKAAIQS